MKKTLLALILAVIFIMSLTVYTSAADEPAVAADGDILLGDVNGDGVVTNADVLMIFRISTIPSFIRSLRFL